METRHLSGKTVVVTRSRDQASELTRLLSEQGATIVEFPVIEIVPPASWDEIDNALNRLRDFHWIIFSSTNAVKFFTERMQQLRTPTAALAGLKTCSVGPKTAQVLEACGIVATLIPEQYTAEGVLTALEKVQIKGQRVLIPRAKEARDLIPDTLRKRGAEVRVVAVYENVRPDVDATKIKELFKAGEIDGIAFTSSSTVRNFIEILGQKEYKSLMQHSRVACIGPVTAETAIEYGMSVDIMPREHTIPALVDAMVAYFRKS